jgi:outer membrane protein OmpA-like peptidoglycan-associated protein
VKKVGKLTEYQTGVKVHIMSEDSNYHETIPLFSDGTFYKMGVPPGEYKAWVDNQQLEILGMTQDEDYLVFNIEKTTYGDFASDIDFTLRYKGDVAKEDLAIDEDTKGLDEIEEDTEEVTDIIEDNADDIASNDNIDELKKEIEDAQKIIQEDTKPEEEKIQAITDIDKKYVIYFSGKEGVSITNNGQNTLDRIAQFMLNNDDYKLGLVGHTDNFSSMSDHLTVSRNRANKAKDYLVSKGISPDRIFARGVGALEPAESNATEEGRQLNRRVEIAIIK